MPPKTSARKLAKAKKPAAKEPTASKTSQPHDPADPEAKNQPDSPESRLVDTASAFEKKIGCSAKSLKAQFTAKAKQPEGQIEKLKHILRDNVLDGRRFGLKEWRVDMAVDEAYRAHFQQITPTLIGKVLNRGLNPTDTAKELERLGLPQDSVFTTVRGPDGRVEKILSRDTYTTVKVPMVKSMLNAREARLFSERDRDPFMQFEPTRTTEEWSVVGEIITQLVAQMGVSLGWKATYREANHQRLKYSCQLVFPQEAWYCEEDEKEDGSTYTVREGLRYNIPQRTRFGWDQTHRPSTFNSDTGCDWATYWSIKRWADIDRNPAYYNKDKVAYSTEPWLTGTLYEAYFKEVYPCAWPLPMMAPQQGSVSANREGMASLYTLNDYEKAVFETNLFKKLSPKEWGFSEYKHKVWFRFVMAADGEVVYAEPLPYHPVLYLGSDADDASSNSVASFALEVIPWQDMVGNILSDIVSAMKQNGIKVILYDKMQITEDKIAEMMARAKESGAACWFPMDWRDLIRGQVDPEMLFKPFTFPQQNIGEKIGTLNVVFNVMERALGISAQETGAIAGHVQTKSEIETISGNVSNRVGLISSMDDDFFDAWKRQIMKAMQAYMDEEFAVEVSSAPQEIIDKMKKDFGFSFDSVGPDKMRVSGKKSKLSVDAFLSTREGRTRTNNQQLALVLFQSLSQMSNTELAMRIGPERMVKMWNRALEMAGMEERDQWKIDPKASTVVEQKKQMEEMQQFAKEIVTKAAEEAGKIATEQAMQQVAKQIGPALEKLGQAAMQAGETAQAAGEAAQQADAKATQVGQGVMAMGQAVGQGFQADQAELDAIKQGLGQLVMRLQQFQQAAQQMMQPPPPPQILM